MMVTKWSVLILMAAIAAPVSCSAQGFTITTVAGGGQPATGVGDNGPATSASMAPNGVALDSAGNLYIADGGGGRIRKVSTSGIITTVAGGGSCCSLGDGAPATQANLSDPSGVAVDAAGNLYIADFRNGRVRKVSTSGIITTYAGGGSGTVTAGSGTAATSAYLIGPNSLLLDASGNLYFADAVNSVGGTVYKVSTSGTITIVAGGPNNFLLGGGYGDGGLAITAGLSAPSGLALDAAGNLYIADAGENRIRKVSTSGIITTFAGSNSGSYSGDGGPATQAGLSFPSGVAVDSSGNVYISDTQNDRIRMVTPGGTITTIAGLGYGGSQGTEVQLSAQPSTIPGR